ncbi:alpha/beta hydrolase family protein [Calderihabitans maritimus]|uniref:Peptidase S9 prolyl oligopeptidase active site domain protein n=1 Tax=Calderihabitans maritimus TaxID=1246530 RepID=A0A1Z5HN72_9FIRM|nr:hypothetical protein [Calderihabitans maritimus]GAW90969.1 peptidase S9 prolyl oligopeptidase active site domain protein [Calderihabitans maritimus]
MAKSSVAMAEKLRQLGKPCEVKIIPKEGHSFSPGGFSSAWQLTVDFFQRHL